MRLQKSTIASGGKPRRRIPDNVGILGSSHPDTTPLETNSVSRRLLTTVYSRESRENSVW